MQLDVNIAGDKKSKEKEDSSVDTTKPTAAGGSSKTIEGLTHTISWNNLYSSPPGLKPTVGGFDRYNYNSITQNHNALDQVKSFDVSLNPDVVD